MKRCTSPTPTLLLCLILCGCITEYEAKHTEEIADILVVEGVITDGESTIVLSRSVGLNEDNTNMNAYRVSNANVCIECDDGMQWETVSQNVGAYTFEMGTLNPERQYRLKIDFEANEYCSEFASPMETPEIDSIFWTKEERKQPVNIHVAAHAPDDMALYYRWSYREDWEIRTAYWEKEMGPHFCSKKNNSRELFLGTTEKTALGRLIVTLAEIPPDNDRLSFLYRMEVTQNAISKRAFDYYTNIKKNARQTGGLFAHVPSEIKGNISCITDPGRTVIGYVDVSSTTRKRLWIERNYDQVYEEPLISDCEPIGWQNWSFVPVEVKQKDYIYYYQVYGYVLRKCVDCSVVDGQIPVAPDDWPNEFQND